MKKILVLITLLMVMVWATGCGPSGNEEADPPPADTSTNGETGTDSGVTEQDGNTAVVEQSNGQIVTIYVGPEQVECTGVAPQTCLQVRLSPDEPYTLFYDTIQGFTHTPGFEYVLQVQINQIENPPADGSSLSYTLVAIVSQTEVGTTAVVSPDPNQPTATSLVGQTWQWETFIDPMGAANIPNSEQYTITFTPENSVQIQADCNTALGEYSFEYATAEQNNGIIQIQLNLTTLALCADGSLSEEFMANLEATSTFTLVDGKLYLDLVAEAGTMILGTGQAGAIQPPPTSDPMPADGLVGVPWQWVSQNGQETPNPQNYIVEFMPDGSLAVKADCNNAFGGFTQDGESLSIMMGGMTMAACPEGSLSDQFAANLSLVQTWQRSENQLVLGLGEAGEMLFTAVVMP